MALTRCFFYFSRSGAACSRRFRDFRAPAQRAAPPFPSNNTTRGRFGKCTINFQTVLVYAKTSVVLTVILKFTFPDTPAEPRPASPALPPLPCLP